MLSHIKKYPLAIFFIIVIFIVPLYGIFFSNDEIYESEKRMRKRLPSLKNNNIRSYITQLNQYTKDNFGLRNHFLSVHEKISWYVFKKSTSPKVIRGKEDWLFFYDSVNLYQGKKNNQKIDTFIISIHSFCETFKNIPIYIIVIPNKSFAKKEFLPEFIQKASQRDLVIEKLSKSNHLQILDLHNILSKNNSNIWRKYDTHWNSLGAYLAYQEIIFFLNTPYQNAFTLQPVFSKSELKNTPRDLASMLRKLDQLNESEQEIIFSTAIEKEILNSEKEHYLYQNEKGRHNVMVVHDSFGGHYLAFYLAHAFKTTNTIKSFDFTYLTQQAKKIQPDFILIEIVDRHISFF